MNEAGIGVIVAFAVLWSAATLWTRSGKTEGSTRRRTGWLGAICGTFILAAGWWWHVPLDAQKSVREFAGSYTFKAAIKADCSKLVAIGEELDRVSQGNISISNDGSVAVTKIFWESLASAQREPIWGLAKQVAECSGPLSSTEIEIQDKDTGVILDRQ